MARLKFRRNHPAISADPWARVRGGVAILTTIVAIGVLGYRLLGLGLFDALYQTVITVTTVGYEEIGPVDEHDHAYRWFSMGLAVFGVSGALYTLGVMVEAFVEGSLNDGLRIRREQRMIDKLSGHVIVTGAGRVGRSIAAYVERHGGKVVVVDRVRREELGPRLLVEGDATADDTLKRAGIERAQTLIAALNSDTDNVYVTLSARALNRDLYIVARTDHQSAERKFFQAGANRVVNPYEIGGSRMGALAMHPTLAEFLDEVLHDESHGVHVEEITITADSKGVGQRLRDVIDEHGRPLVIAIRHHHHGYLANPPLDHVVTADSVLVVLGSDPDVARLASKLR